MCSLWVGVGVEGYGSVFASLPGLGLELLSACWGFPDFWCFGVSRGWRVSGGCPEVLGNRCL